MLPPFLGGKMFKPKFSIVNSELKLRKMIDLMRISKAVALDTETTGLDPKSDSIVGISVCCSNEEAFYIPIRHDNYDKNLSLYAVFGHIETAFKDCILIFHNAKFDLSMFKASGWDIGNTIFDTMIASYLLDSNASHKLDACSLRELDMKKISTEELIGAKGTEQKTFNELDVVKVANYACEDVWCTFKLYCIYERRLREQHLYKLFSRIEMPLIKVLMNMELTGVYCDTRNLIEEKINLNNELTILEDKILQQVKRITGRRINLNSVKDLSILLYKKLGLPVTEFTETGKPSVASSVLKRLAERNCIAGKIYKFKKMIKLKSFLDIIPKQKNLKTGRVHGKYNQSIVRTGRISSSKPNLQNIPAPKRGENDELSDDLGTKIRKSFKAQSPNYSILAADYSQVELRLLASLSGEEKMIEAFKEGIDIHERTASLINKVPLNKVTSIQRKQAKGINFGISYGMGAVTLADRISVRVEEAQEMIDTFFDTYPKIKIYQDNCINFAEINGYVKTLYGRRRYINNINSHDRVQRGYSERIAKNTPIQGTAADIMKIAMVRVAEFIKDKQNEIKMILQVHDELVFEVRNDKAEYYKAEIKRIMETSFITKTEQPVVLEVEAIYKNNWAEAH